MFGWFRRNDGFEWKKYVRTTVRLRRDDRKRKVVAAKDAVARGLKEAGAVSVSASETVASRAWAGVKAGVKTAARGTSRGFRALTQGAAALTRAVSGGVRRGWDASVAFAVPLAGALWRGIGLRPMRIGAALTAGIAATWALSRYRAEGLDAEVSFVATLAGVAGVLAVLPVAVPVAQRVSAGPWSAMLRMASRIPPVARTGLVLGGVVVMAMGVVMAGWNLLPVPSMPTLPKMPTMPSLAMLGTPEITGRAQAASGDTLRLDGRLIGLEGVEAPDRGQQCTRGNGRGWRCGIAAEAALAQKLRRQTVSCAVSKSSDPGRSSGRCRIGDEDLGEALVRAGHVFAETGLFARYASAESDAKSRKVGVWSGDAERPAVRKARLMEDAKKRSPNNCPVKVVRGNAGLRYLMPWDDGYARSRVRTSRGERWFCSEAEARAAGYQPAA